MKITKELLCAHHACQPQVLTVCRRFPKGFEPTVENLSLLAALDEIDVWWLVTVLPLDAQRWYALVVAERVRHLNRDRRVQACLRLTRRALEWPGSVSPNELDIASASAFAASSAAASAYSAYSAAASAAAASAAADYHIEREWQLACLSQLLLEQP